MDLFLQLFFNGLTNGSYYALLGVGFGLIFATTKIVHFAYGPIFACAAYAAWWAASLGVPLPLAGVFAVAVAAVLGVASFLVIYRPIQVRGAPGLVALIASLGLFILLENLLGIVFGAGNKVIENVNYDVFFLGPVFFTSIHLWQIASLAILGGALFLFLRYTRFGKAIVAMTDNREMAEIIGIDTTRMAIAVFAIGSALSAVPAVLILLKDGATTHMGFQAVFMAFVTVVVGGIGSIRGAVVGGFALGLVQSLGLWKIPTEWQSSIAFVVLFLILVARPQGLFGASRL
ncbi:amino acid/amide ABC transporter membrane protein 1, HAAT family [Tistlia consotensis]|uniref:Branched-chain amino acid transport system permease protein n=1 Tax=Tistlia consotensis USBA 355 TaxID=560819 RepID=A0A1Y6BV59_9PROT|nr:branched-chain amino acid ABC transporter permease [Tistlia consotensis]SMF30306.1 branched-chain amino acid transport system permease protein [Tistlia consotensis USBA 355]SNR90204.1 amino acid/amide ABC transporter membrane protein 1, HAAT family [Tistlia consotensis]